MPMGCSTDENAKSTAVLPETLAHPQWGHSYAPEHAPFNMWSKHPKSLFDWYEGVRYLSFLRAAYLVLRT